MCVWQAEEVKRLKAAGEEARVQLASVSHQLEVSAQEVSKLKERLGGLEDELASQKSAHKSAKAGLKKSLSDAQAEVCDECVVMRFLAVTEPACVCAFAECPPTRAAPIDAEPLE